VLDEKNVLAALEKPLPLYSLKAQLDPSSRNSDALHALLRRMRDEGKLRFDIKTGKWSKLR
jgi:hypothetical protein